MQTLFSDTKQSYRPLADILRPSKISDIVGQEHILGEDSTIVRLIEKSALPSLILWGPPGCGKTTLAKLLANETNYEFEIVSAVTSGVTDLKKIFLSAVSRKDRQ